MFPITLPTKHAVPSGELSTIHNGRYWETVFFPARGTHGGTRTIHDVHGIASAAAFADKLNAMNPVAARLVIKAYADDWEE